MSIDPRKGCDPDILDDLEALQSQVGAASGAMKRAAEEITSLRGQLDQAQRMLDVFAAMEGKISVPLDHPAVVAQRILERQKRKASHEAGCECSDCWQQLEGHSRV